MSEPTTPRVAVDVPLELKPVYTTSAANKPIELYEGNFEVEQDGGKWAASGSVQLNWLPFPRITFEARDLSESTPLALAPAVLHIPTLECPVNVDVTSIRAAGGTRTLVQESSGVVHPVEFGEGTALQTVLFHVPNFRDFKGVAVRSEKGAQRAGRAVMECDGWRVTLDKLQDPDRVPVSDERASGPVPRSTHRTSSFEKNLESVVGSGITHVGKLERNSSRTFSAEDATQMLDDLVYFLSFCRGVWVGPLLAVGYDEGGEKVWEEWRVRQVQHLRRVHSWFNDFSSDGLVKGLPGFLRRLRDETWAEPLKVALHWYVEANASVNIEASIVMAQIAFEVLTRTLLVDDRKVLSPDGFGTLPLSDKMRLLISTCKIPLGIPDCLGELIDAAAGENWKDGPAALTGMRNCLVHPQPKKARALNRVGVPARRDAWNLGLWYLELVLLSLFAYRGSYSNRLRPRDKVEQVPWADGN